MVRVLTFSVFVYYNFNQLNFILVERQKERRESRRQNERSLCLFTHHLTTKSHARPSLSQEPGSGRRQGPKGLGHHLLLPRVWHQPEVQSETRNQDGSQALCHCVWMWGFQLVHLTAAPIAASLFNLQCFSMGLMSKASQTPQSAAISYVNNSHQHTFVRGSNLCFFN